MLSSPRPFIGREMVVEEASSVSYAGAASFSTCTLPSAAQGELVAQRLRVETGHTRCLTGAQAGVVGERAIDSGTTDIREKPR